jgi:RNA polymerase sporulation-specific sigma factor
VSLLSDYLRQLQTRPLLRPEEEARLWRAFKRRGSAASRAALIEAYQPLVFKTAMQLRLGEEILMDMVQEGTVGLIEAVERYDPGRGVRFSTFAAYRVRGRMLNALARERLAAEADRAGAGGWLAEAVPDPGAPERFADVEDALVAAQVRAAIGRLPERERRIVRALIYKEEAPRRVAGDLRISLSHLYRLQKQIVARIQSCIAPQPSGAAEG